MKQYYRRLLNRVYVTSTAMLAIFSGVGLPEWWVWLVFGIGIVVSATFIIRQRYLGGDRMLPTTTLTLSIGLLIFAVLFLLMRFIFSFM